MFRRFICKDDVSSSTLQIGKFLFETEKLDVWNLSKMMSNCLVDKYKRIWCFSKVNLGFKQIMRLMIIESNNENRIKIMIFDIYS